MKKQTKKSLKAKAWKEFSRYIRQKYANQNGMVTCVTCGVQKHWKQMQAGHFVPGRTNAILFEEIGVHPQCYSCNVGRSGNLIEYFLFMEKTYGRDVIEKLRTLKNTVKKSTLKELQSIYLKYKTLNIELNHEA